MYFLRFIFNFNRALFPLPSEIVLEIYLASVILAMWNCRNELIWIFTPVYNMGKSSVNLHIWCCRIVLMWQFTPLYKMMKSSVNLALWCVVRHCVIHIIAKIIRLYSITPSHNCYAYANYSITQSPITQTFSCYANISSPDIC